MLSELCQQLGARVCGQCLCGIGQPGQIVIDQSICRNTGHVASSGVVTNRRRHGNDASPR